MTESSMIWYAPIPSLSFNHPPWLTQKQGLVRDTFPLSEIPRESRLLGLAGSIPYVATSISTLALGWDLAKTYPTSSGIANFLFVNHEQARYYIDLLEPIQLGYGAVIISFLGAIHWVSHMENREVVEIE